MASPVDISNTALSYLGDQSEVIAISPPDGSNEAQQCGRFYPMARDEVLESHPWSFATKRVALPALASDRPTWAYAYQVPADCLKPWAVLSPACWDDAESDDFRMEVNAAGSKILYANTADATLRYTFALTDTTRLSPLVVAAISRLLASKLAGTLIKGTAGMQVATAHLRIFDAELGRAKGSDRENSNRREMRRDYVPSAVRARGGDWPFPHRVR